MKAPAVHKLIAAASNPVDGRLVALCTDDPVQAASTVDRDVTCSRCLARLAIAAQARAKRRYPELFS